MRAPTSQTCSQRRGRVGAERQCLSGVSDLTFRASRPVPQIVAPQSLAMKPQSTDATCRGGEGEITVRTPVELEGEPKGRLLAIGECHEHLWRDRLHRCAAVFSVDENESRPLAAIVELDLPADAELLAPVAAGQGREVIRVSRGHGDLDRMRQ